MSSEALDKTVITFGKFFRKKLFQHFIHHKKILKVTKFQFKIICCSGVSSQQKYTPAVHCTLSPPPSTNKIKYAIN